MGSWAAAIAGTLGKGNEINCTSGVISRWGWGHLESITDGVAVANGDTMIVKQKNGQEEKIRFCGMDSPEDAIYPSMRYPW
jgi:endonuclease YncB( thermonuclease family)